MATNPQPTSWADLSGVEVGEGKRLDGTEIEIINAEARAVGAAAVLFDFDGTVSLIRSGWVDVMVPMMVEILEETGAGETHEALCNLTREFIFMLNGKQTIYQMIRLAEEVRRRGRSPLDPLRYKKMYHDRLWARIKSRVEDLEAGRKTPDEMLVPGVRRLIEGLRDRGMTMYCASGTDEAFAQREAELLRVNEYFKGKVYGAIDDYKNYSKKTVIERILRENNIGHGQMLAFGDGYVEIENTKEVAGIAVGVATDEPLCRRVDAWKRKRLILAGADIIIPNYLEQDKLLAYLFDNE